MSDLGDFKSHIPESVARRHDPDLNKSTLVAQIEESMSLCPWCGQEHIFGPSDHMVSKNDCARMYRLVRRAVGAAPRATDGINLWITMTKADIQRVGREKAIEQITEQARMQAEAAIGSDA